MIVKTPGICGGSARVDGTRIPVWSIVKMVDRKLSINEIVEAYPSISAEDCSDALLWYAVNAVEINADIAASELEAK